MANDLHDAITDYLEAQDALDNWEHLSINRPEYSTLMRRRNGARDDLDAALTSPVAPEQVVAWADPASLEAFKREGYIGAESGWMHKKQIHPTDVPLYLAAPASQHIGYLCVNKNWAHRAWPQDAEFVPLDEWEEEHAYTRAEKAYIAIAASPEAAPAAMAQFVEPSWKDTPPDWCTAREEEIWQEGYDCAMGSCRAAASAATPAAPSAGTADLLTKIRALPMVRANEIDGEESDGTPRSWRNRPYVSLTQLERLLSSALAQPAPVQEADAVTAEKIMALVDDYAEAWHRSWAAGGNDETSVARQAVLEALDTRQHCDYPGDTVADRLDAMADRLPAGSQVSSDLHAAATIWRKHLRGPQSSAPEQAGAQQAVADDECQLVGVKSDGTEHVLGTVTMPPKMKARDIVRSYFGYWDDDDDCCDAAMAMMCCEELITFMQKPVRVDLAAPTQAGAGDAKGGA